MWPHAIWCCTTGDLRPASWNGTQEGPGTPLAQGAPSLLWGSHPGREQTPADLHYQALCSAQVRVLSPAGRRCEPHLPGQILHPFLLRLCCPLEAGPPAVHLAARCWFSPRLERLGLSRFHPNKTARESKSVAVLSRLFWSTNTPSLLTSKVAPQHHGSPRCFFQPQA